MLRFFDFICTPTFVDMITIHSEFLAFSSFLTASVRRFRLSLSIYFARRRIYERTCSTLVCETVAINVFEPWCVLALVRTYTAHFACDLCTKHMIFWKVGVSKFCSRLESPNYASCDFTTSSHISIRKCLNEEAA